MSLTQWGEKQACEPSSLQAYKTQKRRQPLNGRSPQKRRRHSNGVAINLLTIKSQKKFSKNSKIVFYF